MRQHLEYVSKMSFGPSAMLGDRIESSKYRRIPPVQFSRPPCAETKILFLRRLLVSFFMLCGMLLLSDLPLRAADYRCPPTEPDIKGPFYKPDAPLRSSVGKGYVLTGMVKSAADCAPLPKAAIEFWLANPDGDYDDQHRATVISDVSGKYRFESHRPPDYGFRPPHIHLRITAEGFKPLVTQHYPEDGTTQARYDIVLIPGN